MKKVVSILFFLLSIGVQALMAQGVFNKEAARKVEINPDPNTDSLYYAILPDIMVQHKFRPRYAPLSQEERQQHWRRIRDIKIVLPYAELLSQTLIETFEYMETLPNDRAREKHLKRLEEELMAEYRPIMEKLTLKQGNLLIKLIDRQTNSTSYEIIKAFYGSFKAGWYNLFAGFFGGNLKEKYNPKYNVDDALTERIIYLYKHNLV